MIDYWQPADREGAISVVREVFEEYRFTWEPEDYHSDLYDVKRFYFDQGHIFLVAKRDDLVVGTVGVEFFDRVAGNAGEMHLVEGKNRIGGADCSLERLYVRPTARRQGIGSALLNRAIREARSRSASKMEIWSDKLFTDAHRLYASAGAVVVGDRILDDPDRSLEWGLILDLGQ